MILQDSQIRLLLPTLFPDHWEALEAEKRVQPASIDLTITGPLCRVTALGGVPVRPGQSDLVEIGSSSESRSWILNPGILYLLSTRERIVVPNDLVVRLDGRSSWGRIGLRVHATAGFIDPGFIGNITLEIDVAGPPVKLQEGDSICQVSIHKLMGSAERPYNSKYQGQSGVTAARALEKGSSK
jgi:dCTP deaminase